TIAMIYGYCMGGAVGLAMACDLRFAAEGSKFGIPAARLSIIYPAEAIAQLVDLVGPAYAKDILYSARVLDGPEALRIGLIQRLVPAADLQKTTDDYLKLLADNAPLSLRGSKLTIHSYLAGYTEESRARLRAAVPEATESADYREGTQAFLEKRRPKFHGRLAARAVRVPQLDTAVSHRRQRYVRGDRWPVARARAPGPHRCLPPDPHAHRI